MYKWDAMFSCEKLEIRCFFDVIQDSILVADFILVDTWWELGLLLEVKTEDFFILMFLIF